MEIVPAEVALAWGAGTSRRWPAWWAGAARHKPAERGEQGAADRRPGGVWRGEEGLPHREQVAHLQRVLQAGDPGDGGAVQGAHQEYWLRILGGPDRTADLELPVELLRRLEDEVAAVHSSTDVLRGAHA